MSAEKSNQLFWLNYGQAIKDKAGANLGSTGVFFLATEAQKGPPAGDDVPNEYTNQGLFDIGNNVLATGNLFYNPSALHGYDEALETFLNWVDTGGNPDTRFDSAMRAALEDQKSLQIILKTQRDVAFAQFNADKDMGLIPSGDFYDYVQEGKVPSYTGAQRGLNTISQEIEKLQNFSAGPIYNMHGAMGNILSPAELLRMFQSSQKIDPPVFKRIPAYNAPAYKQAVQAAMKKALTNFTPPNSFEIKLDFGKSISDFNLGHTNIGGSADVSYGGWFSFSPSADHTSYSETLNTDDESSQVNIKMLYDTIQRVPVTPGSWNADVSKYKLRKDAPDNIKTLATITDLIIVTYLGYEITVGSKTASTIDTKMKETTRAGGSIKILGVLIGLSGSGSSTKEHNTHTATWDNANKTLKVLPTSDTGFATVIGVVGRKFTLAT